jgi:carbonic anhydrase
MDDATKGPMEEWLAAPRQICADHKHELESLASEDARADRVVELNVIAQIERLARNESVQEAFRTGQPLALHGWVYNLRDGLISPLVEYDAENERQAGRKVKAKIVEAQAA